MAPFLASRLRTRLMILSLTGVLPALGVIVYTQSVERKQARERTLDDNLRLTRLAARQPASIIEGAQHLLQTLAQFPALSSDVAACRSVLRNVVRDNPGYTNLFVVGPRGGVECSSRSEEQPLSLPDRPWFQRAMQTHAIVVGDYQISRATGSPDIIVAYPVLGADGAVERVLGAGITLDLLGAVVSAVKLPEHATLTLLDRNRTILARYPDGARWIGRTMPISLEAATSGQAFVDAAGVDGVRRLYVTVPVETSVAARLYVGMGIERTAAFAPANQLLRYQLALLGLVTVAAVAIGLLGGEAFVLHPIRTLRVVTDRLAAGDLSARAQLARGLPGLSELGEAVNTMAVALEARQRERDEAERQLRAAEERYRVPFEHTPHPSWLYDVATLRFLEVNRAACQQYGYTREEFLRMSILDIRLADDAARVRERVAVAGLESGEGANSTWTHRKKDGTPITVEISSMAVTVAGRPARLVLANDISDRHRLEQQLRQAQKMEAVGQLAGGVAHDFNNLLTVVTGYSDLALAELGKDHPVAATIEEILKAGDRAATLTRQLLAFSRKQVMAPEIIDPNALVSNIDALLRRVIGEHIELQIVREIGVGAVKADPNQLDQVLLNLAVNARDAMPEGGVLTIETRAARVDEAHTHLHLRAGRYVVISVRDTGVGMDADTQARIFEPFFTTKGPAEGTGLGLATVYGIVHQSGGDVLVTSEPGKGSTFSVYLPWVHDSPDALAAQTVETAIGGTETILLAEDEDAVRRLTTAGLRRNGYTVLEACSGPEALKVHARSRGGIALLVTDVVMPKMSGLELAARLSQLQPDLKVICVSGYSADAAAARGPIPWPFLAKPFMLTALLAKVRDVLDA
jgi:two-component system cell cycle sensor histidine kinase/response regulator CckA